MEKREEIERDHSGLRSVSGLRIQFLCEYRFYLLQILGEPPGTSASIRGEALHQKVVSLPLLRNPQEHGWMPLLIAILAAVVGILWILGR